MVTGLAAAAGGLGVACLAARQVRPIIQRSTLFAANGPLRQMLSKVTDTWSQISPKDTRGFSTPMSRQEACEILNLSMKDAMNKEMIRTTHRKMMLVNHPDNWGSTFVATKVND